MNHIESVMPVCTGPGCGPDQGAKCDACRLRALCLPAVLLTAEVAALESIIKYRRTIPADTEIYRDQQAFSALYATLSGAVKTYKIYGNGKSSITGIHLPGELFGFSGINQLHYLTNARTLQETRVCEIPFDELEIVCREVPGLQSQLLHLMSLRINDYQEHLSQLSANTTAISRIAAFLLGLVARAVRRGESGKDIRLPATGHDISNYLGIRFETFSRNLNDLVRSGVIAKNNRELNILNIDGLQRCVRYSARS